QRMPDHLGHFWTGLRIVLMAGKSKRRTQAANPTVGDVKVETTGPTVELNGPTAADEGATDGAGRGRKRSSRKTTSRTAGKPRTKSNGRAARKSATAGRNAP